LSENTVLIKKACRKFYGTETRMALDDIKSLALALFSHFFAATPLEIASSIGRKI
jgi:hypothetical protein